MYCDKMKATIRVASCVRNQRVMMRSKIYSGAKPLYFACQKCEKGELAKQGLLNDDDVEELIKVVSMNEYKKCLTDENLLENESGKEKEMVEKKEPTIQRKVCSKCGIEKDVSEFYRDKDSKSGYRGPCKLCTNTKSSSVQNQEKKKVDTKPIVISGRSVLIDFSDHLEIYEELKKLAAEEERSIESQIRYIVKKYIKGEIRDI